MSDTPIEVHGLRVQAGHRVLLDLPAWQVARGAVVAVLGRNGSGKTTLLETLVGLRRTRAGAVRVLGEDVGTLGVNGRVRLRQRIGYLPQMLPAAGPLPLTVREVVAVGRTGVAGLFRELQRDDWQRVDAWIERVNLADRARERFASLSGGEQRRVLLARVLVQEAELLLLDEPAAHLDLAGREQIVQMLTTVVSPGRTVVLVCHELESLPPNCDAVIVLDAGRIAAAGPPAEVLSSSCVAQLYGPGLRVWHERGRFAAVPQAGDSPWT